MYESSTSKSDGGMVKGMSTDVLVNFFVKLADEELTQLRWDPIHKLKLFRVDDKDLWQSGELSTSRSLPSEKGKENYIPLSLAGDHIFLAFRAGICQAFRSSERIKAFL